MAAAISFIDKVFHGDADPDPSDIINPDGETMAGTMPLVSTRGTGTTSDDYPAQAFYFPSGGSPHLVTVRRYFTGGGTTTARYQFVRWNVGV